MTDEEKRKKVDSISKGEGETFYKSAMVGTMGMNASDVREVDKGWSWAVVAGIIMMILGAFAIVYPMITSMSAVFLLGIVLVIGGIAQLVHAITVRSWKGFFWHLLLSVAYVIAGVFLLAYPFGSIVTLALVLGVYFLLTGVFKIILSISSRHSTTNWGWMLFSGIVALVLGVLVLTNWPVGSLWFIGLVIGVDIIIGGFSLAAMGISAHAMAEEEM